MQNFPCGVIDSSRNHGRYRRIGSATSNGRAPRRTHNRPRAMISDAYGCPAGPGWKRPDQSLMGANRDGFSINFREYLPVPRPTSRAVWNAAVAARPVLTIDHNR